MNKKQIAAYVSLALTVYHLVALVADIDQCVANARRVRAHPSPKNILEFLLAEGVLLRHLRGI